MHIRTSATSCWDLTSARSHSTPIYIACIALVSVVWMAVTRSAQVPWEGLHPLQAHTRRCVPHV
jgi:hypothetical protein